MCYKIVVPPLLEVMSVNDKLIVRFVEDIKDNNGNHYPTTVMAIFTLHKNKIQQWDEVVNLSYFCRTDLRALFILAKRANEM